MATAMLTAKNRLMTTPAAPKSLLIFMHVGWPMASVRQSRPAAHVGKTVGAEKHGSVLPDSEPVDCVGHTCTDDVVLVKHTSGVVTAPVKVASGVAVTTAACVCGACWVAGVVGAAGLAGAGSAGVGSAGAGSAGAGSDGWGSAS